MTQRHGNENVGRVQKAFASAGVQMFLVERVYEQSGRWFGDIIDPYSGQQIELVISVCGRPPVAPPRNALSTFQNANDGPTACLQACVINRIGTQAPIIIGWLPPWDSLASAGSIRGSRQRSGRQAQDPSSLPTHPCAGYDPPHSVAGSRAAPVIHKALDGNSLENARKFSILKLGTDGRTSISAFNLNSPADNRIIFQLLASQPGSGAGAIVLSKLKPGTDGPNNQANCNPQERALFGNATQSYLEDLQSQINALQDLVVKLTEQTIAPLVVKAAAGDTTAGKDALALTNLKVGLDSKGEVPSGDNSLVVEWIQYSEDR